MPHLKPIDMKYCNVPRTWTTIEVAVIVIITLLIGMTIGAQAVMHDIRREVTKIEAMDYRSDLDTDAPVHAARARAQLIRERR